MKKSVNNATAIRNAINSNKNPSLIKVDMNSKWAKEELVPALAEIRKNPSRPWTMIKFPLSEINQFKGQRELKNSFLYIFKNFDYKKVDVKSLNFYAIDGECYLECFDGHHTIEALRAKGYTWAWFRLFDMLTLEQEADLFMNQCKGMTRCTPADAFNCARQLGIEPATSILKICGKYNVTVCEKKKPLRNITAPRKIMQIYEEEGLEALDYALGVIELSGWADHDSKAYVEASLNIGYQAYKRYGSDLIKTIKLADELKKYPNSSDFIDKQRRVYNDRSTKHPEGCMGQFVEDLLG